MKYVITVKDEHGQEQNFTLKTSLTGEDKNTNDFILELLSISEDKREKPLRMLTPYGEETYPSVKMKFENFGSPIFGDKFESIFLTWKD